MSDTPTAPAGSLADQIKARVRAADQERIARRADAAAAVATALSERDDLVRQLAQAEAKLSDQIAAATKELMTTKELAEFIGVKFADLPGAPRRGGRKRRVTTPE